MSEEKRPSPWIHIEEELPPKGVDVLFTDTDSTGSQWNDAETGSWTGRRSLAGTLVMDYGDESDWYGCSIWMPIPQLPDLK